ncbi:MAG: hypothetical protein KDA76_05430 [Planctomycetaceae bacterium]|nr:hypothetical protein [Planctomycetaceae bacterium]
MIFRTQAGGALWAGIVWACVCMGATARGTDWHVHPERGDDKNTGTAEAMLASVQRAVTLAEPGDTIHLHPRGAVYRQSILLSGKTGIAIEGNDVTLEGADPLPETGWEQVKIDLFRRVMPRTPLDRHLLILNGRMERMGRTQSGNSRDFPPPTAIETGQFCFETIDEKTGWLYVRGPVTGLEWSTRMNGLATSGENRGITVRNLNARNFLNDGFNLHGHCVESVFENIQGYDCFDEGFSAHDTCECVIRDGKFWGNENAVADVNDCITHYQNCEFRDSVSVDCLLIGKTHTLINCRILNTTTATALSAGPRGPDAAGFRLTLENLIVEGRREGAPARVRINGGELRLINCTFRNVDLNTSGATQQD